MSSAKTVYVVHCVDTEGPLYESLEVSFERLNAVLGTDFPPSRESLRKIQKGELDLGGKEEVARLMLSPEMLDYNDHWGKLDGMLDELLSPEFRKRYADPSGRGWGFSWFVMDHVGYETNPRCRDVGYLNIFDHYAFRLKETESRSDELHWHVHPTTFYREGNASSTAFLQSPHVLEGLSRRIIDRKFFPNCFRAGFHAERPDSHWFLEQWIPFDYSNQAIAATSLEKAQADTHGGRFGDWRRAPSDWSPYHPSHDDYQLPGNCHRTIFRTLNIGTRFRLITPEEVENAFLRADKGQTTVISFADHDWRDMRRDVKQAHEMISKVAKKFPKVEWRNAGAREAARSVLNFSDEKPICLELSMEIRNNIGRLTVTADKDSFGPQPFLAIKTSDKRYLHDNFDFESPKRRWSYTFDANTVPLQALETIGVAVNDRSGVSSVMLIDAKGREAR
jgi:hypothetical protein